MSDVQNQPEANYLKDYKAPDYTFESVDLVFDLTGEKTTVEALIKILRVGGHNRPLVLDGNQLSLNTIAIDEQALEGSRYQVTSDRLTVEDVPASFTLHTSVTIDPANNTSLEGLYKTDGSFCTQCEAEGFRRITYFLDRPDVLCIYRTKIIGDKATMPYMLSNGNKIDSGDLPDGKHWVLWEDPFNKPSYLFALVAGDFDLLEDSFTTCSGRDVKLELYVDKGNLDKGGHAMGSLKHSMKWDEDTFGLEYDLDIYMIVAVDFFNMGAMENKGLNIFNSKYVLAKPETATDKDYHGIEAVIGHEYFHNWTGNRVTCRDWFQLSLKEGLTVFRDQQFSSDMGSEVVNRIDAVKIMRTLQFAEDAGPMAHPIRPEKVIEMNNFYTVTVYDKGAEVIRMMHTLLGKDNFRKGMDLYFERHDGTAVTCDDFVAAMEDASGVDLGQFRRWYSQAGTPVLKVNTKYDEQNQNYVLDIEQINPQTPDNKEKLPLHIPFDFELLDRDGQSIALNIDGQNVSSVLHVKGKHNRFVFSNVTVKPVPVLLRKFSAPVKVNYDYSNDELLHIIAHAGDDFSRWDAAQTLYLNLVKQYIENSQRLEDLDQVVEVYKALLADKSLDKALVAEIITIPLFETVAGNFDVIDVDGISSALESIGDQLAQALAEPLMAAYLENISDSYCASQQAVAERSLKNACLQLLGRLDGEQYANVLQSQYEKADNMTDSLAVLCAANGAKRQEFRTLMADFEQKWLKEPLVMDKWLTLQGRWPGDDVIETIEKLHEHPAFNIENPNRVRSLYNNFAQYNPTQFHHISGRGYQCLTDLLIKLNGINPQTASKLITPLLAYKRFDSARQALVKAQLERLAAMEDLSKDLYEKVHQALS